MTSNTLHPGLFLQELIQWQKITPAELADQTGIPATRIINITLQRAELDQQVCESLAAYFGNSARFWLRLQQSFDKKERLKQLLIHSDNA